MTREAVTESGDCAQQSQLAPLPPPPRRPQDPRPGLPLHQLPSQRCQSPNENLSSPSACEPAVGWVSQLLNLLLAPRRCLLRLSNGGNDEATRRRTGTRIYNCSLSNRTQKRVLATSCLTLMLARFSFLRQKQGHPHRARCPALGGRQKWGPSRRPSPLQQLHPPPVRPPQGRSPDDFLP